ncbi:FAD dependent oxidoreductase [Stanieria cyanosphaera PCC 7437]|uniref:FAD dependent oxidoreductase n=1 Tax=Stanieria cyanosphaera (strain ATCC 29371 / PCC 7437) TaxID=111780 RepID=K9XMI2_STAC7|nr:FAD-dependent monooxygenase [Stanieria cyanosphaera]AFZ33698.1 FAD dependent oxidoreductase [Stanieria cyanosphaera PCC 7437]
MTQVVIVGAGPTGATLALLLVQHGIQVKLIEASRDFRRVFRGEALMPSGLDALKQMGLSELIAQIPHKALDGWEFILEERSLFRVDEPMEVDEQPCTLVSQPHLLEALIQKASNYQEFEFLPGKPVRDLIKQEGRVIGVTLGEEQILADLVIGCDGRNSVVRQKAGLSLEKLSNNIDILWFKLAAGSLLESENIFYSILKDRNGFGLFRSSENELQLGWGLHADDSINWKEIDWTQMLIANSPAWLAQHLQNYSHTITQPILLSVVVGRCPQWHQPGLLLLGDAVHPLSPIRAQGINMALRDVIVAANYLIPLLSKPVNHNESGLILPLIQAEREPEIIRIQQLQQQEIAQAEKLRGSALLRWLASRFAPVIRPWIRQSWLKRQQQLRQGVTQVHYLFG